MERAELSACGVPCTVSEERLIARRVVGDFRIPGIKKILKTSSRGKIGCLQTKRNYKAAGRPGLIGGGVQTQEFIF